MSATGRIEPNVGGLTLRGGNVEFHGGLITDGRNERLRSATMPLAETKEVGVLATLGDLPVPYGKTWRGTGRGGANRCRRQVRERRPVYPGGCGVTAMWSSRRDSGLGPSRKDPGTLSRRRHSATL